MALDVRSTLDELSALAGELDAALAAVLDLSGIYEPDLNSGADDVLVLTTMPYRWSPLGIDARPLVGKARPLLESWEALAAAAVRASAPGRLDAFLRLGEVLHAVLDQVSDGVAPDGSVEKVRAAATSALREQTTILGELPSAHGSGELWLVPDTNSIVYQPALEDWHPDSEPWTAVLVPQVIRELDELKLRDKAVAEAAGSFIRRLGEYDRRGNTFEGVPLRPGASIREVAIEADMSEAPRWLRAGHGDDQLLASTLELRWQDLTARVVLVTRDRNLKNKARLSRVPYIAVEDIAEQRDRQPKAPRLDPEADARARERLTSGLPWVQEQLGVPPASTATNPNKQSWTVRATPVTFDEEDFRRRALGPDAAQWLLDRADALFVQPGPPMGASPAAERTGQMGVAVRREFRFPVKGAVELVADAGGIVAASYSVEPEPAASRGMVLVTVEEEHLRPLIAICVDALGMLGANGRVHLDIWIAGVSDTQVFTAGHPTLAGENDGWLTEGLLHHSGSLELPADDTAVGELVARWGRELARAAGIPARE